MTHQNHSYTPGSPLRADIRVFRVFRAFRAFRGEIRRGPTP